MKTPKRTASAIAGAGLFAALSLSFVGPAHASQPVSPPQSQQDVSAADEDAIWEQVKAFIAENPGDFAGLEALTTELYGKGLSVAVEGVEGTLSGADAQVVLDAQTAISEDDSEELGTLRVPADAFSVGFAFIPRPGTNGAYYAAYGTWDFRDDFVNGSDPDDMASNRLAISNNCITIGDTFAQTYTYDGQVTNASYLKDGGVGTNAPIVGIKDKASGFILNVDHGYVLTDLTGHQCGPVDVRGMFTYEHNQDGVGILNVSAGFSFFNISYTGPASTMQKSTQIADLF